MKLKFEENNIKGDGNCLFRSLGVAMKLNHKELRNIACIYMLKNQNKKIKGTSIKQWIKYESDQDIRSYIKNMRQDGTWGGAIEITMLTKIFDINVFVLKNKENGKGYKIISTFITDNKNRNIFLNYDGTHYNYLNVVKNLTDLKM